MDKILSIRKNNQIFSLFFKIQQYQQSTNRTEIVNAAIQKALEDREKENLNWNVIASAKVPSLYIDEEKVNFPNFMQLRVDGEKYAEVVNQMKEDFRLEKGSPAPFVVKLLLVNYLLFLESNGVEKINTEKEEVIFAKKQKMEEFKGLSLKDKMDAIYELLLDMNVYM